jgi:Tol biopolymer transport system component
MKTSKIISLILLSALSLIVYSCTEENPVAPGIPIYESAYEDSIVFNSPGRINIAAINGSGVRSLCDSLYSYAPTWSNEKNRVIFIGGNGRNSPNDWSLYEIEMKNYTVKRLVSDTRVSSAAYAPNSLLVAYSIYDTTGRQKIKLYSIIAGVSVDVTGWINYTVNTLSWSPDSKNILIDGGYTVSIETGAITKLFDFNAQIFQPKWSPDGTKIAFSSHSTQWTNIHIYDINTKEIKILYEQEKLQFCVSWSRDGKQLIFDQRGPGNATSYICKIDLDGSNFMQITDGTEYYWNPSWYK